MLYPLSYARSDYFLPPFFLVPHLAMCVLGLLFGAAGGTRTPDLTFTKRPLYQLSYCGFMKVNRTPFGASSVASSESFGSSRNTLIPPPARLQASHKLW